MFILYCPYKFDYSTLTKKSVSVIIFFKILNICFLLMGVVFITLGLFGITIHKLGEYLWLFLIVVYLNADRFAK